VDNLLAKVEKKLSDSDVKASLGDYIRLVQLQKELEEEEPKEIRVTWIEPEEKDRMKDQKKEQKPGPDTGT
jgi:hypothetical protein